MKYRTSMISLAMASIVIISMVAAAGVSAAANPIVGGPALSGPSATVGLTGDTWLVAQGAATSAGNIYYKNLTAAGNWIGPIGSGSNPCIVGVGTSMDIFWVQNGALVGRTTTDGVNWTPISSSLLPVTSVAAGTGPAAVYNTLGTTPQLDVFYINSGTNNLMWVSIPTSANTVVHNLGGQVYATPAAALASDGSIQLVVKGGSSRIYEATVALGGFDGYTKLHDGLIGAGAALVYAASPDGTLQVGSLVGADPVNLYLIVAGTNNQLYIAQSSNNGYTWTSIHDVTGTGSHSSIYWGALGGITKLPPSAIVGPVIYVTGGNGAVWQDAPTPALPPISAWTSIAGP